MASAVTAIASVIGAVGSAVATVVTPIASAISAAVAPAVAAIGSVVGAIAGALGTVAAPIFSTVSGIASWVTTAIGQTVGGLVKTLGDAVGPFVDKLGEAISTLTKGITKAAEPILSPIRDSLQFLLEKVQAVGDWVSTAFHPSAELEALKTAHPEVWAASDGSNIVFRDLLVSRGLISSTKGALILLPDALETISQVATLKVLADLVQGQASVSDLLNKVAQGKGFETAAAIAQLSKSIVSTSVGIMDRVDTEVGLLRAGIDTFDERLETSLKDYARQTEAEVLALVTPKLDILGDKQSIVIRELARVSRHIDDEAWFAFMLLRALS